jgi:hypothetical protein
MLTACRRSGHVTGGRTRDTTIGTGPPMIRAGPMRSRPPINWLRTFFAEVTRVLAEHGIDDTVIGEDDTTKRREP